MAWFTHIVKWLPQQVELTSIISYRYTKKKRRKKNFFLSFLLAMKTLRIYSFNNFPVYHTTALAIAIMLYFTALVLMDLYIWKFGPYNHLLLIPLPHPPPLATTSLISFSTSFFFFLIPYIGEITQDLFFFVWQCRRPRIPRCRFNSWDVPLEEEMVTHSSILAWKNPMDRGAWRATVHRGHQELDTTEQLSTHNI